MPELDRVVAGMRCREVLADLSDYVDGQLSEERVAQIQAHLRGCDWCERFGGEFSRLVERLRLALAEAPALDEGVERRLLERLRRDLPEGPD